MHIPSMFSLYLERQGILYTSALFMHRYLWCTTNSRVHPDDRLTYLEGLFRAYYVSDCLPKTNFLKVWWQNTSLLAATTLPLVHLSLCWCAWLTSLLPSPVLLQHFMRLISFINTHCALTISDVQHSWWNTSVHLQSSADRRCCYWPGTCSQSEVYPM